MMDFNELLSFIEGFKKNRKESPVVLDEDDFLVLKLYKVEREESLYQEGKKNTIDKVTQRDDFFKQIIINKNEISEIQKYISFDNLTLKKELKNFSELQNIQNENLSMTSSLPVGVDVNRTTFIDHKKYCNYLDHLKKIQNIKQKTSSIVKDKFNVLNTEEVDTSAIFSNVGYIVKGFEGKYIKLSRWDRTFIKNFMDEQIKDGFYKLTIKETLPLYKESIKEIISIGKEMLELNNNKTTLKSFSKNKLGKEMASLEGCWQLYFDRYLRVMLMSYKEFYSQFVFKPMLGYDKDSRPDFLAVDIYNNVDIIEIKTHKTILFRKEKGRDSYYPSADLNKSIFQLNKYMDLRSGNINLSKIENEYTKALIKNEKIYRPRGILIISSMPHISAEKIDEETSVRLEKEIKKLKTTYNNIDIILFDELINNLENYIQYIEASLDSQSDNS